MADFTIKRNDTKPLLTATLKSDGVAVNLLGATVKFIMKKAGAVEAKVNSAATVTDAAGGAVEYAWVATDTDKEGDYNGEFEVTDGAGKISTFPNGHDGIDYFTIEITEDLG